MHFIHSLGVIEFYLLKSEFFYVVLTFFRYIMRRYPPHSWNTLPFSRFYRPTLPLLARFLGRNSHYPLRYQFIYLGRMKRLVCLGGA